MSRLPLQKIIDQFNELNTQMMSTTDPKEMIKLSKRFKKLNLQHDLAESIRKSELELEQANEMLSSITSEDEMYELLQEENQTLAESIKTNEEELLTYLSPHDPRDDMDIILELRAGAGGDEASLFVGEMLRMYEYVCSELGFKMSLTSSSPNPVGGMSQAIAEIRGDGAFEWFKYEGGVHRVQRVPATEKQGRIHTSTISIAVMPLVDKNDDFKLDMSEVEVIITTSTGAGGQSVNTTYSAVQMRHNPTGIEARSQDERNQIQNREKALQVLTSRVFDHYEQERLAKEYAERKSQVGSADRSEKIRTYNFPQDRLTDHRYNTNWSRLPDIMNGKMLSVIQDTRKMEAERSLEELSK